MSWQEVVDVSRRGKWGNAYSARPSSVPGVTRVETAWEAVLLHRRRLAREIRDGRVSLTELALLCGFKLKCFCPDGEPCHKANLEDAAILAWHATAEMPSEESLELMREEARHGDVGVERELEEWDAEGLADRVASELEGLELTPARAGGRRPVLLEDPLPSGRRMGDCFMCGGDPTPCDCRLALDAR